MFSNKKNNYQNNFPLSKNPLMLISPVSSITFTLNLTINLIKTKILINYYPLFKLNNK